MKTIGINLTGGGARGAYQAGALLGLGELLQELNLVGERNPVKIWSGNSAGAINSTFMAAHAEDFLAGAEKLATLWRQLTPNRVYETGLLSMSSNSARWIRDLTFGPLIKRKWAEYLLDTSPLLKLLTDELPFEKVQEAIAKKRIKAVTCSTYCYSSSETVTFLQAAQKFHWHRRRRRVVNTELTPAHILASCSIPLLFPPTQLQRKILW